MLKHFHITARQWKALLKWTIYGMLFLLTLMFQTVILAKHPPFGVKPNLVAPLLVCVCIREGAERGGVFALLTALIWCFSGADYGNLSVAILPVCAILSAVLCRAVLTARLIPTLLFCLLTGLIHESAIFALKVLLAGVSPRCFVSVVLPAVGLSLPAVPLQYLLAKTIGKIGGGNDL